MSTIKDVAKMAGVSISTVSLAFNSPERVSEHTREKVFSAARSLNWYPIREHKKVVLNKYKSESIAVISHQLVGPYFFEILRGISETIYMNKKKMVLYSVDEAVERCFFSIIRNHEHLGVILVNATIQEKYLKEAIEAGFPVVMCCYKAGFKRVGSVLVNNKDVGRMVANHFIKRKFVKIGILGKIHDENIPRKEGFIQTLEKNGIMIPPKWDLYCD